MGKLSGKIRIRVQDVEGRSVGSIKPDEIEFEKLLLAQNGLIECAGSTAYIKTQASASAQLILQSHTGSAYVTNLKMVGGYVELYNAKLINDLDANGYDLNNIYKIMSRVGDNTLVIYGRRSAFYAGDAIAINTRNASDIEVNRILIAGGVDTADIKIVNAYLDFNDQTLAASAGSLAGYFIVKVGGTEYKVPAYNLA